MKYVQGQDRHQIALFPDCIEDYIGEDSPVKVIDAFADGLDLSKPGFIRTTPRKQDGLLMIQKICSSFMYVDISTGYDQAASL